VLLQKDDIIIVIAKKLLVSVEGLNIPFTAKQKPKIKADNEFICLEYVTCCYAEISIQVKWNKLGFIAPSDFASDPNFELVGVLKKKWLIRANSPTRILFYQLAVGKMGQPGAEVARFPGVTTSAMLLAAKAEELKEVP
jgi:hypothetical protein